MYYSSETSALECQHHDSAALLGPQQLIKIHLVLTSLSCLLLQVNGGRN